MATQQNSSAAEAQHELIGTTVSFQKAFKRSDHPDAQWFENAGLGMFLHWGISAVSGKVDLSWGMVANTTWDAEKENRNKLTPNEYWALAKDFKPEAYDPKKWLQAAKEAGFTYAVLTTKHHDGYSLWPSKVGELNTATYWNGRDLVREYVEACREVGLKVGLYYSPPDWYFDRKYMSFHFGSDRPEIFHECGVRAHYDLDHRPIAELPEKTEAHVRAFRTYIRAQIEELLTWYGKVDVLWFDGSGNDVISIEEIRALQPGIVVNPRMHGVGDFQTPECHMPDQRPEGWWEVCHLWNEESWGYHEDEAYKDLAWMLTYYCRARAWGGNFLANCAPDAQGQMPKMFYQRLDELKAWLAVNGEAVRGVKEGGYPKTASVPYVIKGDVYYLYLLPGSDSSAVLKVAGAPKAVSLLGSNAKVEVEAMGEAVRFTVDKSVRSGLVDVIKAQF